MPRAARRNTSPRRTADGNGFTTQATIGAGSAATSSTSSESLRTGRARASYWLAPIHSGPSSGAKTRTSCSPSAANVASESARPSAFSRRDGERITIEAKA